MKTRINFSIGLHTVAKILHQEELMSERLKWSSVSKREIRCIVRQNLKRYGLGVTHFGNEAEIYFTASFDWDRVDKIEEMLEDRKPW